MRRTKRWPKVIAVVAVLALVVGVAGYCAATASDQLVSSSGDSSHEVGAKGGTYTFHDGIEITVPDGAVEDGTTLSVGEISQIDQAEHAPFDGVRTGAVSFDVSLSKDGNDTIQPAKPLDITIPLQGNLLPDGVNPESALLYTATESGYLWMPPPLDENGVPKLEEGVLHAKLLHLSPKFVSYLDEDKFLEQFGMANGGIEEPEDCLEKTETAELVSQDNWSNTDPASPINACLAVDGDGTHVGIVNRLNYILSVASTTDSEHLEVSYGGFDEELVKTFASAVFPNAVIDTYLGRGGRMDATFAPDDLPATIQLRADPNTYLSEIGWFALKFVANIFTGGVGTEVAKALLDTADVVSCLQTTFDLSDGDVEGFGLIDAVNYMSSKCVEEIANAVGYQPDFWGFLGRVFNVVSEGIAGGLQTIMIAFEGIRMQFVGNLTIEVEPMASYVGEWFIRRTSLNVYEDGTGELTYPDNGWICEDNSMCAGHREFTWELMDDGTVKGVFTKRWSEGPNGDTYTPEGKPEWDWYDLPGETFTLFDLRGQASVMFIRNDVPDREHFFCGPEASHDDLFECGVV